MQFMLRNNHSAHLKVTVVRVMIKVVISKLKEKTDRLIKKDYFSLRFQTKWHKIQMV